ncbi:ceramide glucosyltransferase [Bryocella elongata]|uniref:Ceramide glucosyltransferase n=1 Tax=Bryocella elongata TaxID=863522 RepID=A0A1H5YB21_9BACT|nr:bacteriohopanetetrol glucosamine biosynthesis glycosyltransferase HpnI [Bryocella elongata]SEG20810.1 ceramide glucosyltransferase [Bryocella elongata]
MDPFAVTVEAVAGGMTAAGIAYSALALAGARSFLRDSNKTAPAQPREFSPGVSILKPVKGLDPNMYAGLVSHCQQRYAGPFELVFGVNSLEDSAVSALARLRVEYPEVPIQLIECTERLGSNGKVSNLVQMLRAAKYEYVIVNDSDIVVGPDYLTNVLRPFAEHKVGLVTVPYFGRASDTLWSRLEALGISTDFLAGVLTARKLEGGISFGLGSTLATTKTALGTIGGFETLVNQLADDYELGARLHKAGWKIELIHEVVATSLPAYGFRGFCDHQLRWSRAVRDSRKAGYVGLCFTYVLPWALATVLASGCSLWSVTLLSVALVMRVAVALQVGVGVLRDAQVLQDLWLLPLRDCFGLFFWAWSYASNTIVWRGERFRLKDGELAPVR